MSIQSGGQYPHAIRKYTFSIKRLHSSLFSWLRFLIVIGVLEHLILYIQQYSHVHLDQHSCLSRCYTGAFKGGVVRLQERKGNSSTRRARREISKTSVITIKFNISLISICSSKQRYACYRGVIYRQLIFLQLVLNLREISSIVRCL